MLLLYEVASSEADLRPIEAFCAVSALRYFVISVKKSFTYMDYYPFRRAQQYVPYLYVKVFGHAAEAPFELTPLQRCQPSM